MRRSSSMRIGIYFKNKGLTKRDCTHPYLGNPGMGGSEWQRLLLGYYLSKKYHIHVCYYMEADQAPPLGTYKKVTPTYEDAIKTAEQDNLDWFITNNLPDSKESRTAFAAIRRSHLSVIYICDCFVKQYEIIEICKTRNIKKVICVGDWQYRHLDQKLYKKAKCIHHFHPMHSYPLSTGRKENIVMYQGALKSGKGFLELAKIWKYVKKFVPNARLEVLGSGQLYGSQFCLGKYGLAEESYEKQFMQYLSDQNGQIRKDVKFWGNKGGQEKTDIAKRAKVGIMNPSCITETWGLSASEFEAMGIPVVTGNKFGCKNSVKNFKGGFRFNSTFGFVFYIVILLKFDFINRLIGLAGRKRINKIGNADYIVKEWYDLLH